MSKKTFLEDVIKRFMTAEEYSAFVDKYNNHKKTLGWTVELTQEDRQMVADVMSGDSIKEVSKKYNKSEVYINKRVVMILQGK